MEKELYIVRFGNSSSYRFYADKASLESLGSDIKKYMSNKFPELSDPRFYDKMTVKKVEGSDAEYNGYPEFDDESIEEIKKILSTEAKDSESVSRLNSNAPWNS